MPGLAWDPVPDQNILQCHWCALWPISDCPGLMQTACFGPGEVGLHPELPFRFIAWKSQELESVCVQYLFMVPISYIAPLYCACDAVMCQEQEIHAILPFWSHSCLVINEQTRNVLLSHITDLGENWTKGTCMDTNKQHTFLSSLLVFEASIYHPTTIIFGHMFNISCPVAASQCGTAETWVFWAQTISELKHHLQKIFF